MAELDSVCEHLHLPLQSGSDRTLARMRRGYTAERYLERLAAARAAIPDLAVTTDIIVGFPGETDEDFERTLEVVDAASYDAAYTFVFSPRPGTAAAEMVDDFVPAEVVQERFARLEAAREPARRASTTRRGSAGSRRSWSRARRRRIPTWCRGRTRQNKLVHVAAAGRRRTLHAGHVRRRAHHRRRRPLAARRAARGHRAGRRRAASASRSPQGSGPRTRHAPRARRADRVGQVRARARGRAARSATSRSSRSTRCRSTGAWTSAPRSRRRPSAPRSRTTCRRRRPVGGLVGRAHPGRGARRGRRHRGARQARAARSAAPGSTCRPWSTTSASRARTSSCAPRSPRASSASPTGSPPRTRELEQRRPGRGGAASSRRTPAASSARSRSSRPPAGRSRRSVPASSEYGPTGVPGARWPACGCPRACSATGSSSASTRCADAGLVDEVRALAADPRGWSRTARQAIGYKEMLAHLRRRGARPRRRPGRRGAPHPGASPGASGCGSAGIPASPGSGPPTNSCAAAARPAGMVVSDDAPVSLAKLHATGNDFLVHVGRWTATVAPLAPGGRRRALCDRHRGIGADGLITIEPGERRRRLHDGAPQRRRRPGRDERQRRPLPGLGRAPAGLGDGKRLVVDTDGGRREIDLELDPATDAVVHATVDMGPVTFDPLEIPLDAPSPFDLEATFHGTDLPRRRGRRRQPAPRPVRRRPGHRAGHPARPAPRARRAVPEPHQRRVHRAHPGRARRARPCGCGSAGVGETLSCGTGACASAAVAHHRGLVGDRVVVHVPGGDLAVDLGATLRLGGPVAHVFDVDVDLDGLRA